MAKQQTRAFIDPAFWDSENIAGAVTKLCEALERATGKGPSHFLGRGDFTTICLLQNVLPGLRAQWVDRDELPDE